MPILYNDEPVEIAEGRGDLRFTSVPFDAWASGGGGQVPLIGGKVISYGNLFANQNWVAAAVMRMLTWSVRVPLKLYRRTGDDSRERVLEGPLADALRDPWERGSQAQLVMSLLGPLLVHGNGINRVLNGARDAVRFDPLDWRTASPVTPFARSIAGWKVTEDGATETLPADQVIHVSWWSPLGPVGVSPLQQLGVTISIEEAAQRYQRAYLGNSAQPPNALFLPGAVFADETVRGQIRADLEARHGGPDRQGKTAILPDSTKWETLGHTAHEAELIDQRRLTREEVAAVYMIPPPMLGILDKATFSNIETQREMSYTDSLAPPMVLIEQLLNAQLVRGLLREQDLYVEFDFAGVLRGDRLKEIQALREAIGTGVLTPNEGRKALNYPAAADEAADQLYLPFNNLAPLGTPPRTTDTPDPEG